MDKETLSNYGWIVICVLVLAVMIALATPFGSFISEAVQSTTKGLFDVNKSALDSTGLINIDNQEFDVPDMNHGAENNNVNGCDTVYWDGNREGLATCFEPILYKVSDAVPQQEDFVNGAVINIIGLGEDHFETITYDEILGCYEDGIMYGAIFAVVPENSYGIEPGTYIVYYSETNYMTQLTIPGYTGFPHSEHCGH